MKAAHNTKKQYLYVNAYYGLQSGIRLLVFLHVVRLINSTDSPKSVLVVELPSYPLKFDHFQEIVGQSCAKILLVIEFFFFFLHTLVIDANT